MVSSSIGFRAVYTRTTSRKQVTDGLSRNIRPWISSPNNLTRASVRTTTQFGVPSIVPTESIVLDTSSVSAGSIVASSKRLWTRVYNHLILGDVSHLGQSSPMRTLGILKDCVLKVPSCAWPSKGAAL